VSDHVFDSRTVRKSLIAWAIAASLAAPASPLLAQRIAPSGVQRLDVAPRSPEQSAPQPRSHVDGAVHGAAIGLGAGALTGVAVYVAAHVFVSAHDTQVVTPDDKVIFFWWAVGAGALAGGTLGAVIGGIIGR
jgi:hypothetical protein